MKKFSTIVFLLLGFAVGMTASFAIGVTEKSDFKEKNTFYHVDSHQHIAPAVVATNVVTYNLNAYESKADVIVLSIQINPENSDHSPGVALHSNFIYTLINTSKLHYDKYPQPRNIIAKIRSGFVEPYNLKNICSISRC